MSALVERFVTVHQRMASLEAESIDILAEAMGIAAARSAQQRTMLELPLMSIAAELGCAVRIPDRTIASRMDEAATIRGRYPATFAALSAGRISRQHARVIVDAGAHIDEPDARAAYEESILDDTVDTTVGRLRRMARRRAEKFARRTVTDRHRDARAFRRVIVLDGDDGMSDVIATLPTVIARGIHDRITQMATQILHTDHGDDDERGIDERGIDEVRADVFADLLLAAAPTAHEGGPTGLGAIRATVQVTIPALSLLGSGTEPAELAGCGPMDLPTARALAGHAPGWDRLVTHPVTGALLTVDRYQPSESIKRMLRARDEHCRFPGCRQPAVRTDRDHTKDAAKGGETCVCNLCHLCRRHHVLKHNSEWTVRQLGHGVLEWTSPTGRVYVDTPETTVRFAEHTHPGDVGEGDPPWMTSAA